MLIIGLTGSIGMGKTTVAAHIAPRGVPVLDSDAAVHRLYAGEAVPLSKRRFPADGDGKVDRAKLAAALMRSPDGFAGWRRSSIRWSRQAQWRFMEEQQAAGAAMCVLDIPLLFETGGDATDGCDPRGQRAGAHPDRRVAGRPGMTPEKLAAHPRAADARRGKARPRRLSSSTRDCAWEETHAASR